jgi:hypothetical protein
LAYHGAEIKDESSFNPKLFITPPTLEQRMTYLKRNKFTVLSLSDALKRMDTDQLPDNTIVITVDDGWYSTKLHMDRIFLQFGYPYTIYVTSYYVSNNTPVLNIVLQYMLWSCRNNTSTIKLDSIPDLSGSYSLSDMKEKNELGEKLFDHLESLENNFSPNSFFSFISERE